MRKTQFECLEQLWNIVSPNVDCSSSVFLEGWKRKRDRKDMREWKGQREKLQGTRERKEAAPYGSQELQSDSAAPQTPSLLLRLSKQAHPVSLSLLEFCADQDFRSQKKASFQILLFEQKIEILWQPHRRSLAPAAVWARIAGASQRIQ